MRGDSNRVLEQHTGELPPPAGWAGRWARLLARRDARLRDAGITWVGHVAPDKESVYPELLPAGIVPAARRPIDEFLAAGARVEAPVRYGLAPQLEGKPGGPVYCASDTHWNARGAWIAATEICAQLRARGVECEAPAEDRVEWRPARIVGDLGSKLHPTVRGATVLGRLREHRASLVADNRIRNHGRLIAFERGDGIGPTAVLFGESFANPTLPFLKEAFSRLLFAHASSFDFALLRRERPDAVIWLPVERFLREVPSDRLAGARLRLERARKRRAGRIAGPPGEPGSGFLAGTPSRA